MRQQVKIQLNLLQQQMQQLNLWQTDMPHQSAFESQEPFCLDTMSPEQWLQWVFIPRMFALLESDLPLPQQIAVSPYLEESLKDLVGLEKLLSPMREIELILTRKFVLA